MNMGRTKLNVYVDRRIVFRLLKVELKTEVAFLAQNKLITHNLPTCAYFSLIYLPSYLEVIYR